MKLLPEDPQERKKIPIYSGVIKYFPRAIIALAKKSAEGNEQHNPGTELHWDRSKSGDELDAHMRHLIEEDWVAHAWRAMANLEKFLEKKEQSEITKDDVIDRIYKGDISINQARRLLNKTQKDENKKITSLSKLFTRLKDEEYEAELILNELNKTKKG